MKRYAHVNFPKGGEKGAMQQDAVQRDMIRLGIIDVPESELVHDYELNRRCPVGAVHHYVLHNGREIRDFRKLMRSGKYRVSMPDIQWRITWRPQDKAFQQWLRQGGGRK